MSSKKMLLGVVCFCMIILCACGEEQEADEEKQTGQNAEKPEIVIELPVPENESEETLEEANQTGPDESEKKEFLISIDPGHQSPEVDMSAKEPNAPGSSNMKTKATGGTTGRYSGIPEYQLNLDISLMLRDELEAQGYDVIMTRENNDTAISNAERATLANEAGADIAVRIHANGSESTSANGALVLIGSSDNPYVGSLYEESLSLGEKVLDAYCSATGMKNLGVQTNDTMTGINWSQIPVIILEMGFMTNEQDDLNMADSGYREKMVEGIVTGINAYYESVRG
ncbi:N-acetylmuramoyl-L-alanine amidase [Lachnoclostridium sp. An169]|nr:N-acetylmuramoyl-L-alanine amidase [Lachnoclostridium sp. An169]